MKSIYQSSGLKRTAVFLIFTAVIAMTSFSPIMAQDDQIAPEGCLVQISATHQTIDPLAPWQSQPTGTRYGYGVLIDEKHVLTTESLVRNCKRLELLSHRSGKIFSASLIIADCQTDLALLDRKSVV